MDKKSRAGLSEIPPVNTGQIFSAGGKLKADSVAESVLTDKLKELRKELLRLSAV